MLNYFSNIIIKCSLLLLTNFIIGCNDILEKNIEKSTAIIIIPKDNDTLLSNLVHFKWEELKGATDYELHIVKPNFDNISTYVLDSVISDVEFKLVLAPGEYQYKIRGINSAYASKYTNYRTFFVDSVSNLSDQLVQLLSPDDNFYTNQQNIEFFAWQSLFFADNYNFQLWTGSNFGGSSLIHQQSNIYGVNYNYYLTTGNLLSEGVYSWGVSAVNEVSESDYNSRTIYIDTTAPNNPDITFPPNNYISNGNQVTLKWTKNGNDYGLVQSPVVSNVEISYEDSLYSNANLIEISNIVNDSLQRNFINSGSYWWRVYLSDKAGNESYYYSVSHKLVIP